MRMTWKNSIPLVVTAGLAGAVSPVSMPVLAEELKAVKQEAPNYPRLAQKREIEGWVKVKFTVTSDGEVQNPVVVEGEPSGVFDSAAIRAVSKWKYESPAAEVADYEVKLQFKLGS